MTRPELTALNNVRKDLRKLLLAMDDMVAASELQPILNKLADIHRDQSAVTARTEATRG